MIDRRFSTYQ